jgi:hypothetical protein
LQPCQYSALTAETRRTNADLRRKFLFRIVLRQVRVIPRSVRSTDMGRPYPEVTAAVLPNSLTRVLPFTLVYSTYPPVLVVGTDASIKDRGFSWKLDLLELSRPKEGVSTILGLEIFRICLENKPTNN